MLKLKLQHFDHLIQEIYMLVAQLYPILFNPMDCSLPGSSVHGILHQEYWSGLPFPSPCRDGSLEKTLMLGKIEGRRRREQQRMRWLDGIPDWMDMNLSKLQEMVKDKEAWHAAIHGVVKIWICLGN